MTTVTDRELMSRPCGLYRTTRPLPGAGVPADLVVSFHAHDDDPRVHLPVVNELNRWEWRADPIPITDQDWIDSLEPLPPEGFYVLREDLVFERVTWPRRSLVQLGYDRAGNPIVFLAQQRYYRAENALVFADRGVPIGQDRLDRLEPVVVYEEPDPNLAGGEADPRGGAR